MFTAHDLIFNGHDFGDILYVESVERQLIGERKHRVIKIPGRAGYLVRASEIGEKKIKVLVRLIETDRATVMTKAHTLSGMLHAETPKALYTRGDTLYDMAVLDGEVDLEQLYHTGYCELEFINYSGLQYGEAVANGVVNGTPITVAGTYPARPIFTITFSANSAGVTISNTTTGKSIALTGNYVSGNVITINCEDESVKLGSTLIMSHINNATTRFFDLIPGSNVMTCSNGACVVTYTPRYI